MLQVKYKQSAGELLLVLLVTTIYLGSIVGAVLPHVDREMDQVHHTVNTDLLLVRCLNTDP